MNTILIISNRQEVLDPIQSAVGNKYEIKLASEINEAVALLSKISQEFVFLDSDLLKSSAENTDYRNSLSLIWNASPLTEVVVMCSKEKVRDAIRAVKAGASDYITCPIEPIEVKHVIDSIHEDIRIRAELDHLRDQFWRSDSLDLIRTKNPMMRTIFDKIRLVAPTSTTVLLLGETGTGKGVLARLIHNHSNRKNNQFISVHCGAIPDTLLESELFGHEKGAFTGAIRQKLGKFEIAHGGTIFLDEIGTLTASAQIKLLQVLQEGVIQRVGSDANKKVDVRVISATNADLRKMRDEGCFRKDLFYRVSVFPIEIPSLSQRREDIPQLVETVLKRMERTNHKGIRKVDPAVIDCFKKYDWPGNIRELENLMEQAYVLETSRTLTKESLPVNIIESGATAAIFSVDTDQSIDAIRSKALEVAEKSYLKELLAKHRGKINKAAANAEITTRQLHNLLSKYGIRKEDFKSASPSFEKQEI